MLKSTYNAPPQLPPGWTEHRAPSGHLYYYNSQTKQSTYKRPVETPAIGVAAYPPHPSAPTEQSLGKLPSRYDPLYPSQAFNFSQESQNYARGRKYPGANYQRGGNRDRPKSKHVIPGCEPWLLVKTRMNRRFVYNPESNESFWKFPKDVLKAVTELDRIEREKRDQSVEGKTVERTADAKQEATAGEDGLENRESNANTNAEADEDEDEDEYEEVEVTDDEGAEIEAVGTSADQEADDRPMEFNEDDIEYQLAAMGGDPRFDPEEYGEQGEDDWEEGDEDIFKDEDAITTFRNLLDDYRINPYTPWETTIEEGSIINDSRYTVLPNMKSRRDVWSDWSRDRIKENKEAKVKVQPKDPRVQYFAFLQERATPKLYWPEFKRKYRKDPEMKHSRLTDKDREKYYRDHIERLKLPDSKRKSDFLAMLKSVPLHQLNRSTKIDFMPNEILTDLRYISLPSIIRDELLQTYIPTLEPAPEEVDASLVEKEGNRKPESERQKQEMALASRRMRVQEDKRRQREALDLGRDILHQEDNEIQRAMQVGKGGLKSHFEHNTSTENPSP